MLTTKIIKGLITRVFINLKKYQYNFTTMKEILEFDIPAGNNGEAGFFPLRKSPIWEWQRQYFDRTGADAWNTKQVPHYITSNPFTAHAYAQVVFGFLRDWIRNREYIAVNDRSDAFSEPIYLLELGTGSGRFSYHFMKQFFVLVDQSPFRDVPFCYVMTDFTETNIATWRRHEKLQSWVQQGRLDFARFDVEKDTSVLLRESGRSLAPKSLHTPLVLVANYFFDSLRQDLFFIEEGEIYEGCLVGMDSEGQVVKDGLSTVKKIHYRRRPITTEKSYTNPLWRQILTEYTQHLDCSALLFPYAGLKALENLQALSKEGFLLLSADRGATSIESLQQQKTPKLSAHGGAFSLSVNYHLIGRYLEHCGASIQNNKHNSSALNIMMAVKGRDNSETKLSFQEAIATVNPDDFCKIRQLLPLLARDYDINFLLPYLRLSHWDISILVTAQDKLLEQLPDKFFLQRKEWCEAIERAADMFFDIGEPDNINYICGALLEACRFWQQAGKFYQRSLSTYTDAKTYLAIARCYWNLGQIESAQEALDNARSLMKGLTESEQQEVLDFEQQVRQWQQFYQSFPQGRILQETQSATNMILLEPLAAKHQQAFFQILSSSLRHSVELPLGIGSVKTFDQLKDFLEKLTANPANKYFALLDNQLGFMGIVGLVCKAQKKFVYIWISEQECCGDIVPKILPTLYALTRESSLVETFYFLIHQTHMAYLGIYEDKAFQKLSAYFNALDGNLMLYCYLPNTTDQIFPAEIISQEIETIFSM